MATYFADSATPRRWRTISTSADVTFDSAPTALFIGGAGDVVLIGSDGAAATFKVPAGTMLPVMPAGIRSAGTTATAILALG